MQSSFFVDAPLVFIITNAFFIYIKIFFGIFFMSEIDDIYDLRRFIQAQDGVYQEVLAELRAGRKRGHWMWFIFPQIRGLGQSGMARRFAISGRREAAAYLGHGVLGARLRQCTRIVLDVPGRTAEQIFYYPDNLKFRSSMTLFMNAAGDNRIFKDAIQKYFGGEPDALTLEVLRQEDAE